MRNIFLVFFLFFLWSFNAQTVDATGKKQGYWKKRDEKTNKLIYEGMFKENLPVGKFKYYYTNDSIRAIMDFKNEGKIAYAKLFHMNGKRMASGKYLHKEIKDSVWVYFDEAGVLISKENYKAGKKNGTSYIYLPDGTVSEERNFLNNQEHGIFKQYFEPTKLKGQGNYVMGKLEGRVAYFYPNGVEVAAGFYKNGQKSGPWIYKNENGSIKERELYINGKLASKKDTDAFFSKTKTSTEPVKTPTKKASDTNKKEENQY